MWLTALRTVAAEATGVDRPTLAIDGKTLRRSHDRKRNLGDKKGTHLFSFIALPARKEASPLFRPLKVREVEGKDWPPSLIQDTVQKIFALRERVAAEIMKELGIEHSRD